MNAVVALPFRVSWDRLCRQSSAIEARSRALLAEALLAAQGDSAAKRAEGPAHL